MTMVSFFMTMTLASFLLMFFPDDSFNKLENLLRFVVFLIITVIFGTLALIVIIGSGVQFLIIYLSYNLKIIGSGVQLLVIRMRNTIANTIYQFMAEINMNRLDMDDFEARMEEEEEKPKLGRRARKRKNKMEAKRLKLNDQINQASMKIKNGQF